MLQRELKLASWTLLAIVLAIGVFVGPPLYQGYAVDREFLSHDINKQIFDRYSDIGDDRGHLYPRFDVTDLFQPNIKRSDYERELVAVGYVCDRDTPEVGSKISSCRARAGFNLVCRKDVSLIAELDAQNTVREISAWYMLTCL